MRLSASQLESWSRCPTQYRFEKVERRGGKALSMTLYGTVMHHALRSFEEAIAVGKPWSEARDIGLATFDHYWNPSHIEELCETRVEVWIRRDSYGSLRQRGLDAVQRYAHLWRDDQHTLLALEYPFEVPVEGSFDLNGEQNTISGFIDRLVLRKRSRNMVLDVDDWKAGVRKPWLRHFLPLTVYCYANTQRAFWDDFAKLGYDPEEMAAAYQPLARHANWYDINEMKIVDAGFRGPVDYARLSRACTEVSRSVQAAIFPLSISGENCRWCAFADICPDESLGLPPEMHGGP